MGCMEGIHFCCCCCLFFFCSSRPLLVQLAKVDFALLTWLTHFQPLGFHIGFDEINVDQQTERDVQEQELWNLGGKRNKSNAEDF